MKLFKRYPGHLLSIVLLILLTDSQLVQEIESQAILAQREITVVKTAVSAKQRDVRLLELTTGEVKLLPKDTKVYEGVGKMRVSCSESCQD